MPFSALAGIHLAKNDKNMPFLFKCLVLMIKTYNAMQ